MQKLPTTVLDKAFVASLLRPREPGSHKGDHGHALLVAGSRGKMGAAILASRACLRTGVGLLTVSVPEEERSIIQTAVPEAMVNIRAQDQPMEQYNAIGIGPALGLDEQSERLLDTVLRKYHQPLVLDADALTLVAKHPDTISKLPSHTILTPHAGEFDRLFGPHANEAARQQKAIHVSSTSSSIIVLKGHRTQISTNGVSYTNTTGNAGLAKGGSGDVLTGMILALLAQGYSPVNAACLGVYLHGLAADIAVLHESEESLLASDVIGCIGKAFRSLLH